MQNTLSLITSGLLHHHCVHFQHDDQNFHSLTAFVMFSVFSTKRTIYTGCYFWSINYCPGCPSLYFRNGKMWTCSGTQRIMVASKRSEYLPGTFGVLIWFFTTSTYSSYNWPMPGIHIFFFPKTISLIKLYLTWKFWLQENNQHTH